MTGRHKPPSFFDRHPFLVFGFVFVGCFIFISVVTSGR